MTEPLTPPDCDLRDFEFMPLEVRRLRDSRMASASKPEEFRAAVMLWCASWHQVPAASLPDDNIELSNLAGYGRTIKEWMKWKAGAMSGWLKCSDGRLYHPVVAEKALESWRSKLEHAYKRFADRMRKENKRLETEKLPLVPVPTFEVWNAKRGFGIPTENASIPAEKSRFPPEPPERSSGKAELSGGIPTENALKGIEGKGEVNLNQKQDRGVLRPETARETSTHLTDPWPKGLKPETWALWRTHCTNKAKPLTTPQEKLQLARLCGHADPDGVVLDTIEKGRASLPPIGGWDSEKPRGNGKADARTEVSKGIFGAQDDEQNRGPTDITGDSYRVG